jgi:uncharacterized GH25 family protein
MSAIRGFWVVALATVAAAPAVAHSPYLLPNYFDVTDRDHVSVQASFTERFFIPDVVMRADGYHVLGPDGARVALTPLYTKDVAILDVETKAAGTYRISTGLREGASRKAALVKGQWEFFESREAPADSVDMQSWTRADVYVSSGKPTDQVLVPTGTGIEFQLLTHPNNLHAGSTAKMRLLFDGKPLANEVVTLQGVVTASGDNPAPLELRADAEGRVDVPLKSAGMYQLQSRHRVGPAAAGTKGRSYTIAVTLEIAE